MNIYKVTSPSGSAATGRCAGCGENSLYIKPRTGLCPKCGLKKRGEVARVEPLMVGPLSAGERARLLDAVVDVLREAGAPGFDPWLTIKQLADESSFGQSTLRRYLTDKVNSLPHVKVGSKVFVRRSEFNAWMEAHRQPLASDAFQRRLREIERHFAQGAERRRRR